MTAARVAAAGTGSVHLDLVSVGDRLVFTRADAETGAQRAWSWTPDTGVVPVASDHHVRSRVHEYGAGAIVAGPGPVVVVDFDDQRLWQVEEDGSTRPLTDETDATVRFAAGARLSDGRIVVVRERHGGAASTDVHNELVVVDPVDGSQVVLDDEHDFVGDPLPGPDGWVAWSTWDHPAMPWDEATLWIGRVVGDTVVGRRAVAGGRGVSLADWAWQGPDLLASDDRTGWWQVTRHVDVVAAEADDREERLTDGTQDLGQPRWLLGRHWLAVTGDTVWVVGQDHAHGRLGVVEHGTWTPVTDEDVVVEAVVAHGEGVATIEVDPDGTRALRIRDASGGATTVDAAQPVTDRPGDRADIEAVTVDSGAHRTHAFVHLPANADVTGPADERPPLVVFVHGGPTGQAVPAATPAHAFFTTRGFVVADVNYRGSSGYGRAYREQLRGAWGVVDVEDVVAVARELAARGVVDGDRMVIRGGSAGGFTALAALTSTDHPFACGTSFYGVADLERLAASTHKFESRYLDGMVGRLPEARELFATRSPLSRVQDLDVPILVLQGLEDRVVPPNQARAIVAACRERGVPHALLTFEGEGHGFRKPSSVVAWLEAELAFYGEVLGFRPAGDLPRVLGDAGDADVVTG